MEIMIGLHVNMFYQYVLPVILRCIQQKTLLSIPLISSIGNYSIADLHCQYKKYIHKRPKHILL
jgi:hypothetical protein